MIADIQKFEDAARMAMGHFEAPRPRSKAVLQGFERRIGWAIACVAVVLIAGMAIF